MKKILIIVALASQTLVNAMKTYTFKRLTKEKISKPKSQDCYNTNSECWKKFVAAGKNCSSMCISKNKYKASSAGGLIKGNNPKYPCYCIDYPNHLQIINTSQNNPYNCPKCSHPFYIVYYTTQNRYRCICPKSATLGSLKVPKR